MPSKHMLPKGKRRHSVKAEYRATRGIDPPPAAQIPTIALQPAPVPTAAPSDPALAQTLVVPAEALGLRLDQYLAQAIPELSRSRVQLLVEQGNVLIAGAPARTRHKVSPGEEIRIAGRPIPPPLAAEPEDIPLSIIFEDEFLAVVDKPAGMMVHAGAAAPDYPDEVAAELEESPAESQGPTSPVSRRDPRSRGTLVNALLHHFSTLSQTGGDLRPGIVHRLDKQTSGLILVAKDDLTHRQLGELFSSRAIGKTYLALVHGHLARTDTTVSLPIGRDLVRRTRMTTRRFAGTPGVRSAVSHVHVLERLNTPFGPFTRVSVTIETGRTHQIRVHLQSLGHPVVGDTLYGAPRELRAVSDPPLRSRRRSAPGGTTPPASASEPRTLSLPRNFLHAAELRFTHPRTARALALNAPLPPELLRFLDALTAAPVPLQ